MVLEDLILPGSALLSNDVKVTTIVCAQYHCVQGDFSWILFNGLLSEPYFILVLSAFKALGTLLYYPCLPAGAQLPVIYMEKTHMMLKIFM